MYCNNCGTQNPDGVKFCSNCGGQLLNASAQTASAQPEYSAAPAQPNASYAVTQPEKKKNGKLIGIIAGVAVVVIVAIIVVVIAFIGGKNNDENAGGTPDSNIQQNIGSDEQVNNNTNDIDMSRKNMSYEEVTEAFLKAYWNGDFNSAKSYSLIDVGGIIVQEYDDAYLSNLYSNFEKEFGSDVKNMEDLYATVGKAYIGQWEDFEITDIDVHTYLSYDPSDSGDRLRITGDAEDCFWWDVNSDISEYFDISELTGAYNAHFNVFVTTSDGQQDTASGYFSVVECDGVWYVLADPVALALLET